MAKHDPNIMSDRELNWCFNMLLGYAPKTAAKKAGFSGSNHHVATLIRRVIERWLTLGQLLQDISERSSSDLTNNKKEPNEEETVSDTSN